jgi:hypothetical protein
VALGPVATALKTATFKLSTDPGAAGKVAGLEITARPIAGPNARYLVAVFADEPGMSDAKLLGSFSFFPVRIGEPQTFVLPTSASVPLSLSVKLIPANPNVGVDDTREIADAAVEITGARLICQ